ncbi:hypothetical protein IAT40_007384 [Kwoniella sp. CBS 6097]
MAPVAISEPIAAAPDTADLKAATQSKQFRSHKGVSDDFMYAFKYDTSLPTLDRFETDFDKDVDVQALAFGGTRCPSRGSTERSTVKRRFDPPPPNSYRRLQFIGMSLVDRVGRRKLTIRIYPGMIIGLVWAIISFHFLAKTTGSVLGAGNQYPPALVGSVLGAILLFVASFGLTYSHMIWYQSEFLALEIRAVGSAISTCFCWLANLVVSVAYLTQLSSLGTVGTYGMYLAFISIGYVFVYFCYPETKGLSIDEIRMILEDDFGVKKADAMLKEKKQIAAQLHSQA